MSNSQRPTHRVPTHGSQDGPSQANQRDPELEEVRQVKAARKEEDDLEEAACKEEALEEAACKEEALEEALTAQPATAPPLEEPDAADESLTRALWEKQCEALYEQDSKNT